jgi:iron complex outermembrane receptor protein
MGTMASLNSARNTFESVIETNENATNSNHFSSRFIEDGSYVRLADLTIGYTIPFNTKKIIKNLRLYATGNNLLLFTKYTGYDPDVNTNAPSSQGYRSMGIDNTNYPKSRSYIVGLSATF